MEEGKTKYRLSERKSDIPDRVNTETDKRMKKRSTVMDGYFVTLLVIVILCIDVTTCTSLAEFPFIKCMPGTYTYRASMNTTSRNGLHAYCEDEITVLACRGRCDSYEWGSYKEPFKQQKHRVCMYGSIQPRVVKLRRCLPEIDDPPEYKTFDATSCVCSSCDSEYTSCENLNG